METETTTVAEGSDGAPPVSGVATLPPVPTPSMHPSICSQSVAYASKYSSHVETEPKAPKSNEQPYVVRSATAS